MTPDSPSEASISPDGHGVVEEFKISHRAAQRLSKAILEDALVLVAVLAQDGRHDDVVILTELLHGLVKGMNDPDAFETWVDRDLAQAGMCDHWHLGPTIYRWKRMIDDVREDESC